MKKERGRKEEGKEGGKKGRKRREGGTEQGKTARRKEGILVLGSVCPGVLCVL